MDVNITSSCSEGIGSSTTCIYSGRVDNIKVSIPMLEAMGLITTWVLVCACIAILIKKFS